MEISEIHHAKKIEKIQKKGTVSGPSAIEDRIHISHEAEQRLHLINKLKEMPDIRPEKMEYLISIDLRPEMEAHIAQKILEDII